MLLQAVINAVTGQDIVSTVSKYVFEPLGMQHSRMLLTQDIRDRVVAGTSRDGVNTKLGFREANAAASLYTTATDYAKLLAALLADESLLSLTLASPISVDSTLGLGWGHGWGIEVAAGGPYLWQWGNNPGFRTFTMVSAKSKNGFVLLTNSEQGMPLAAPVARLIVPAEHKVFRFHMLG